LQEEILKETDDQSLLAWGLDVEEEKNIAMALTGVFATSPAAFLGSEDVVPIPRNPERQPQSMTSRGLRIEVPLWVKPWTKPGVFFVHRYPFAILDCQYKDDFTGAIGIPLIPQRDRSTFMRNSAAKGIKCPILKFENNGVHPIYIIKSLLQAREYIDGEICVIRARSVEDIGYDIFPIGSHPSLWNQKTKVGQIEYKYLSEFHQQRASVAIAFCNPGTESCFIVMITVKRKLMDDWTKRNTPTTRVEIFAVPDGTDRLDLEAWVRESQQSDSKANWKDEDTVTLHNVFKLSEQITFYASAKREEILNQEVMVLNVDFNIV
jgi:hypothetical protein